MNHSVVLYYAAEGTLSELESCVKSDKSCLQEVDYRGRNALFHSALTDNVKNLQFLLKKGINPRCVDNNGNSVLHWATRCGAVKVTKHLLSLGNADEAILHKDKDSVTPLHVAASKPGAKILTMFIEALTTTEKVFEAAQDKRGRSPLHYAAGKVNIDAIRAIVESNPSLGLPIDQRDKFGLTPLMCAVGVSLPQTLPVIRYLVKKKAVAREARNRDGQTALHLAVAAKNILAVRVLIDELHCQLESLDNESRTPLHYAAEQGFDDIVTLLLSRKARNSTRDKFGVTPAHYAAQFSAKCLEKLLTHSGITEVKDDDNRTCLMWAVTAGNIDAIHYLIQRKEAPERHATDKYGFTALHLAAMVGNENVCKILINQGWSIADRDKSNNTALHLAAGRGHTEVVRVLVTSGANMNERDAIDRTPVFWACLGGQAYTLYCMIKELGFEWRSGGKEARPLTDALGRTPLHAAAFAGFSACISVLLNIEVEDDCLKSPLVGWRDYDGKTALHEACLVGRIDCVQSLLKGGSAINAMDKTMRTPLDCAMENNHKHIVDHLASENALTGARLCDTAAGVMQRSWRRYRAKHSARFDEQRIRSRIKKVNIMTQIGI